MYPFFRGVLIFIWEKIFIIQKVNFFSFEPLGGMRLTHRITSHRDQTEQNAAWEMRFAGIKTMGIPFYPFRVRNQIPNGFQIECVAVEGSARGWFTLLDWDGSWRWMSVRVLGRGTLFYPRGWDVFSPAQMKWMVGVRTCWAAYVLP